MNKETIKELALTNGFKLKWQIGGSLDLNPYVYEFAAALISQAGRDGFIAGADSYFDRHSDEEMSEHVLNSAEKYANKLRQQAKGE